MWLVYAVHSYPYEGCDMPDIFALFPTPEQAEQYVLEGIGDKKDHLYRKRAYLTERDGTVNAWIWEHINQNDAYTIWCSEKVEMHESHQQA